MQVPLSLIDSALPSLNSSVLFVLVFTQVFNNCLPKLIEYPEHAWNNTPHKDDLDRYITLRYT